jgi:putative transposase
MRELDFSTHNLAVDLQEVKRMFREDFNGGCRYLIKQAFEGIMRYEADEYLRAERYERCESRRSHRNGSRSRSLLTSVGAVELTVPRTRDGGYNPDMFKRYKRVHDVVNRGIREMFLKGVSTRKVRDVLDVLCGVNFVFVCPLYFG